MTPLELYTAYRSAPLLPEEAEEFGKRFGKEPPTLVATAIRQVAVETGRVSLAAVAHRYDSTAVYRREREAEEAGRKQAASVVPTGTHTAEARAVFTQAMREATSGFWAERAKRSSDSRRNP